MNNTSIVFLLKGVEPLLTLIVQHSVHEPLASFKLVVRIQHVMLMEKFNVYECSLLPLCATFRVCCGCSFTIRIPCDVYGDLGVNPSSHSKF